MTDFWLYHGDCVEVMDSWPENSIDAIVCDPPYDLTANKKGGTGPASLNVNSPAGRSRIGTGGGGFMNKGWDSTGVAFNPATWAAALRVLKPGGHLLAFGGTRTSHRMICAIEDGGFEIRDSLSWNYGCLSEDTEILVGGRWGHYHEATVGSRVLCYDVEHGTYSWQPIQDRVVYDYDDQAFRIQGENTDQLVSRSHRCVVERDGTFAFVLAEHAAREREVRVPIVADLYSLLKDFPLRGSVSSDAKEDVRAIMRIEWPSQEEALVATQGAGGALCSLPEKSVEAGCVASPCRPSDLFMGVQRSFAGGGMGQTRIQESIRVDGKVHPFSPTQDEWPKQPRLEGRRDLLPEARQLQTDQVRPLPGDLQEDGSSGWVHHGTSFVCGASAGTLLASERGCPPSKPQPAGQQVAQSRDVCVESRPQTVRGARYTETVVARISEVHYQGMMWCVRVPTGAFVARRNGKVFVTGNSGFPKSLNLGDGRGTALKPSHEPICLARKPLDGTVAANVIKWGTGALNIDACRITTADNLNGGAYSPGIRPSGLPGDDAKRDAGVFKGGVERPLAGQFEQPAGRWPANLILDEEAAAMLDAQTGCLQSGAVTKSYAPTPKVSQSLGTKKRNLDPSKVYADGGGASRFFYCTKASRAERDFGLEHLPLQSGGAVTDRVDGTAGLESPRAGAGRTGGRHGVGVRNFHPT